MSPTARSLARLRQLGDHGRVGERCDPFAKIRQDFFGADILAWKAGEPILVLQATTGSNHAARRAMVETEGFIT